MHFYAIAALSLALAPALSLAEPQPYLLRAATYNELFGLMKRQAGYAPSPQTCGPGATCAEACGPNHITCPSDAGKHCFDPSVKQICCSDGSGLACDDGYFCTLDSTGGTWCCPNGLDLVACAAMYSVTGLSSLSAYTAAPTTPPDVTTAPPANMSTTTTAPPFPPVNSTVNVPAPSPAPPTFSGAANARAVGGLALPLALAGALAAL
jgi:hypothetical protein